MLYSGHLIVKYTVSWNHETNRLKYPVKIFIKPNYSGHFISAQKVLSQKNLYIADDTKKLCSAATAGL